VFPLSDVEPDEISYMDKLLAEDEYRYELDKEGDL